MNGRQVVILSGVRTAIGDYGGTLKDIPPTQLGATVVREAVARARVDPGEIGQCVLGNVIHTEAKDMYIARVAAIQGGLPVTSGALTLNRLCGSGLQAIVTAAQYIYMGDVEMARGAGDMQTDEEPHATPPPLAAAHRGGDTAPGAAGAAWGAGHASRGSYSRG